MKNVIIIILAVALLLLGMLYIEGLRSNRSVREHHVTVSNDLVRTTTQLVAITNQLTVTQTEVAAVKLQLAARTTELEQRTTEKVKTEEQLTQSRQQADAVRKDLLAAQQQIAEQAKKIGMLEVDRGHLVQQLGATSNQLAVVSSKFSDLERAHADALALIEKLRQRVMRLEMEKASLERRLNDLETLREQVRVVKQRLWEVKLAELKRQNEEGLAKGNRGFIMQEGQWKITAPQTPK